MANSGTLGDEIQFLRSVIALQVKMLDAADAKLTRAKFSLEAARHSLSYIALTLPVGSKRRAEIQADADAARNGLKEISHADQT